MSWSAVMTFLATVTSQPWFLALEATAKEEFIKWATSSGGPIARGVGSPKFDQERLQAHVDTWRRSLPTSPTQPPAPLPQTAPTFQPESEQVVRYHPPPTPGVTPTAKQSVPEATTRKRGG